VSRPALAPAPQRDPCPGKPGGYAREAHRPVRGVHGLEHADGVEMRIVVTRRLACERRGRYLEVRRAAPPATLRRALFHRLGH